MKTYICWNCTFRFTEAEKPWDLAIECGRCPKCRSPLRDFPVEVAHQVDPQDHSKQDGPTSINYCPHCGIELTGSANFCGSCGASLKTPTQSNPRIPRLPTKKDMRQDMTVSVPPIVEEIQYVWRRVVLPPLYQKPVPDNLSWMLIAVDIVFTETDIIVIAAPEKSRLAKLASAADSKALGLGMLFGPVGWAATITAAVYSSIYDSLYDNKNQLGQNALNKLFREGLVAYARKDELECDAAMFSSIFGWSKEYVLHISGNFTSRDGASNINLTILDESSFGGPHLVRPGLDAGGFEVGNLGQRLTMLSLKKKQ